MNLDIPAWNTMQISAPDVDGDRNSSRIIAVGIMTLAIKFRIELMTPSSIWNPLEPFTGNSFQFCNYYQGKVQQLYTRSRTQQKFMFNMSKRVPQ